MKTTTDSNTHAENTGPLPHQCIHEKDFDRYDKNFGILFKFKDKVLRFMGAKEVTNGNLEKEDRSLKKMIEDISEDVKSLQRIVIMFMIAVITIISVFVAVIVR